MSPGCAASPSLPPLPSGHPMVVTQSSRALCTGTVVAPGDAKGMAVPCASRPCQCPVLSAVKAGGGELEKLGREVWEPCRSAGLGAGACQAQMGSLVVVKIIQPLLKNPGAAT